MQSFTPISQIRTLRLLAFRFRHRMDWTKLTKPYTCSFQSLGWYPFKGEFNYEIGLLRWSERRLTPLEFFEKMIGRGVIYSLEQLEQVTKNTYLVGFTGPYANTLREKILEYGVGVYTSNVRDGTQEWTMVIHKTLERGFLDAIRELGCLYDQTSKTPSAQDIYDFMLLDASAMKSLTFLLSDREYDYILRARQLGYFEQRHNARVEDIARILGRNPSTVNRGIRSGINKIVSYITTISGQAGHPYRQTQKEAST
jgi:Predicted DNA binding protein